MAFPELPGDGFWRMAHGFRYVITCLTHSTHDDDVASTIRCSV